MTTHNTRNTKQVQEQIQRLQNHATLYELTASQGERSYLIAYCGNKSRQALWKAVTNDMRAPKLMKLTGTGQITFKKRATEGATMGTWRITFSGRTERQAIASGELPYIGNKTD